MFVCVFGWYPFPDVVLTPLYVANIFSTITINRLCVFCPILLFTGGDALSGVLGSEILHDQQDFNGERLDDLEWEGLVILPGERVSRCEIEAIGQFRQE